MRLCSFPTDDGLHAGAVLDDDLVADLTELAGAHSGSLPRTLLDWIGLGDEAVERLTDLCASAGRSHIAGSLADLQLTEPLGRLPRNVICVGANYREHIEESEEAVGPLDLPDQPVWFTKDVRSICGPYDDIATSDKATGQLDWEVELAVVIGRAGRNIDPSEALGHVFGYAVLNDVSARDVQLGRKQWWKGKSLELSSPFGPYIVTRDEVPDPQNLELYCWVDGVEKQHSNTKLMIHDIAALISDLSRTLTLEPGDVISTGTPAGVGLGSTPPQWLRPGAVLESEITGLGRQRNRIIPEVE
ncbi:fumarylacetoacetate hydrolase family protein [Streptomyces sp. NPDC057580]|uniref:fumarylacetoacetate hydrolase family protein n=1 Tax=Streptomyces sp. NPDC057580 TaxID=3346173 RepID=UPI00367C3164